MNGDPLAPRMWSVVALISGAAFSFVTCAQPLPAPVIATATYKTDYSFDQSHGSAPAAQLLQAKSGRFYGTTQFGGAYDAGTVFQFDPVSGKLKILHSFIQDGHDGIQPIGSLIEDEEGVIYGTTALGGSYFNGTVFRLTPEGAYQVLHAFQGGPGDGSQSYSALVKAGEGTFFGTTSFGGAFGQGCVFKMSRRGDVSVLYSFAGPDGAIPQWGVTLGYDGALYGTTTTGGTDGSGTIYRITTAGTFTLLYSLSPGVEGAYPSRLALARNGSFYGTTPSGGTGRGGTAFSMNLAGAVTLLHSFTQGADEGDSPSGLIQTADGNFVGANANFGSDQLGTVFKMTSAGAVTTLHKFAPGSATHPNDGQQPLAPPIQAKSGVLYGTTSLGGIPGLTGYGTIYQIANP